MYYSKWFNPIPLPFTPSLKVVVISTPYFSYVSLIFKGSHPGAVCILLPALNYPSWYTQVYNVLLALNKAHMGLTWSCTRNWGINLVDLWYS